MSTDSQQVGQSPQSENSQQVSQHDDATITDQDVSSILEADRAAEHEEAPSAEENAEQTEQKKAPPQSVPIAVHIRERQRHAQQLQSERAAWQQQQELVNQRLGIMWQALQQQQQAPVEPPPDENTDPIGAISHATKQTQAQLAAMQQSIAEQQRAAWEQQQAYAQQQAAQRAVVEVSSRVKADEDAFRQDHPDYMDAVRHARDMKAAEYSALGLDDSQVAERLRQDAWSLALHAQQNGVSVAEFAYQIAQALGYRRKDGSAESVVSMRQQGQRLAAGGGGGGSGRSAPTFAELAAMSPSEFEKLTKGDNWKRIAGG